MSLSERRLVPRRELGTPLWFRALDSNGAEMLVGELQNISERGIYFTTNRPLEVGALLELLVSIPSHGTKQAPIESRCTARVVHVRIDSGLKGQVGIGASIERVERAGAEARLRV